MAPFCHLGNIAYWLNRRLKWDDMAEAGTETRYVPGGHQRALGEPHVRVFARQLMECLQQSLAPDVADATTGPPPPTRSEE